MIALWGVVSTPLLQAQEESKEAKQTQDESGPVFRISRINPGDAATKSAVSSASAAVSETSATLIAAPHPLDRAIAVANESLAVIRNDVQDYTGIFVRRECINGAKAEAGYVRLKVRCPRETEQGNVPFSIYMKFLKPRQSAGRECIWVDGVNDSKIVCHEAKGLIGMRRFYLDPTGLIAMRESKYPIYEAGIENLIVQLIQKAERDRAAGNCEVNYRENGDINGRKCLVIEVIHSEQKQPYDFHKAQVFIDHESRLPICYTAYGWPHQPGDPLPLIEEYHYLELKTNVGLSADDFCADNPEYKFPRR